MRTEETYELAFGLALRPLTDPPRMVVEALHANDNADRTGVWVRRLLPGHAETRRSRILLSSEHADGRLCWEPR